MTVHIPVPVGAGAIAVAEFAQLPDLGAFATMTQSLWNGGVETHRNWFSVSWTLTLEEWFYVLLPVLLFAGQQRAWRFRRLLLTISGVLIAGSIAARFGRHLQGDIADFDDMFRRAVLFRLDALC